MTDHNGSENVQPDDSFPASTPSSDASASSRSSTRAPAKSAKKTSASTAKKKPASKRSPVLKEAVPADPGNAAETVAPPAEKSSAKKSTGRSKTAPAKKPAARTRTSTKKTAETLPVSDVEESASSSGGQTRESAAPETETPKKSRTRAASASRSKKAGSGAAARTTKTSPSAEEPTGQADTGNAGHATPPPTTADVPAETPRVDNAVAPPAQAASVPSPETAQPEQPWQPDQPGHEDVAAPHAAIFSDDRHAGTSALTDVPGQEASQDRPQAAEENAGSEQAARDEGEPFAQRSSSRRKRGGRKSASRQAAARKDVDAALEEDVVPALAETAITSGLVSEDASEGHGLDGVSSAEEGGEESAPAVPAQPAKKSRNRSRRGRRGRGNGADGTAQESAAPQEKPAAEPETAVVDPDQEHEDAAPEEAGQAGRQGREKMFVSVLPDEQVEVVVAEEGHVQEYYVEMLRQAKTKGNIYKAVIHNVDPNLQAAFVSYGAAKNGFLQIDEVHPEYYVSAHEPTKGRKYPPIQKVLRAGQELLVQVVKEPTGTKGAFLTTYLSMPGRFLVLTPGREQIGVSRKVEQEGERMRLRELLEGLSPGPGLGVIVRTVSMGTSKTNLQRDLQMLKRTWKEVRKRGTTEEAPCLIYQEMGLISRAVRDYLTEQIAEVWVDDEPTAVEVAEVAKSLFPRKPSLVRVHKDQNSTLFERFNLQRQLDQIHSREVSLPSGGRLVIDPTEALTAIDINSGRSSGKNNFEDMAYRTNLEAARMIPLQLRLRDIGGQVVVDFIEMRDKNHWREVEKALRQGMKIDRARYDVGKIGPFGLLEIVRQRLGSSAISISTEPCPHCKGTGVRRNMEWQCQQALRELLRLARAAHAQNQASVVFEAEAGLALHLLNNKRQRLMQMEEDFNLHIEVRVRHAAE